jgi:DNA-binding response OmpR family regulator
MVLVGAHRRGKTPEGARTLGYAPAMRILVVEDENDLAVAIATRLREEAFGADVAGNLAEARYHADLHPYDLVILDRRLPDGDGLTLCGEWRADGSEVPILMLTAMDDIDDRVAGLESGADDYLTKPFATEELVARVRTLLRRAPARRQPVVDVGALRVETARRRVRKDGVIVPLTVKEFALVAFLADRAGEVVDRYDILEHCWDHAYEPESNVVDVHVAALRRKLGAGVIETVRGAGYRLVDEAPAP